MKPIAFPMICAIAAGCSTPANPPSLLPRAIELRPETASPPTPVAGPQAIDLALTTKLKALLTEARAGNADFVKAEASGVRALEAGRRATLGSEAWVAAELVRSALQVARQRSAGALAEIDTIAVNQSELALRNNTGGDIADILAAQGEIEAIVTQQTTRLDALSR
jgi:hypothetical protein